MGVSTVGPLQLLPRIVKEKVSGCWYIIRNGNRMEWNRRGFGETFSRCILHTKFFFGYLETVLYFWGHVATCTQDFKSSCVFHYIGLRASALTKQ